MALYTFDLRGRIGDRRPEETLEAQWKDKLPKTDRFGVHTYLIYNFVPIAGQAVLVGDKLVGLVKVPKSEMWEVFSVGQVIEPSIAGDFSAMQVALASPPGAFWSATANIWTESTGVDRVITRPRHFIGTDAPETFDEASETFPDSGLRTRILYSESILKASVAVNTDLTIGGWLLRIDCVRYPSNAELLRRLDAHDISRNELLAALALRFPSPAEAF